MEWSFAEQGEKPLVESSIPDTIPTSAVGGGNVGAMVGSLRKAVAAAGREPDALGGVAGARMLAEAIAGNLRPPNAQSLTKQEARDLRTALRGLEALEDAAESDAEAGRSAQSPLVPGDASSVGDPLEIESGRRRRRDLQQRLAGAPAEDAYSLRLEAEREEEIDRISGQVSTVNAIYRDLASLVGAQQEDVDQIEALVANSHERTARGQAQLERAVRRRTSKNKCCMYFACFLLFVIVLVVLAVLALKRSHTV